MLQVADRAAEPHAAPVNAGPLPPARSSHPFLASGRYISRRHPDGARSRPAGGRTKPYRPAPSESIAAGNLSATAIILK
jgi:hypothetical protein